MTGTRRRRAVGHPPKLRPTTRHDLPVDCIRKSTRAHTGARLRGGRREMRRAAAGGVARRTGSDLGRNGFPHAGGNAPPLPDARSKQSRPRSSTRRAPIQRRLSSWMYTFFHLGCPCRALQATGHTTAPLLSTPRANAGSMGAHRCRPSYFNDLAGTSSHGSMFCRGLSPPDLVAPWNRVGKRLHWRPRDQAAHACKLEWLLGEWARADTPGACRPSA